MQKEAFLKMRSICKAFYGNSVLQNIDIDIYQGEVHALLGENGAGKSTLIKILAGIYLRDSGEIYFDNKLANINNINDATQYGISYINQEVSLVPGLSVSDNVFLGDESIKKGLKTLDKQAQIRHTEEIINRYGLELYPNSLVSSLSIAQQQMVEITRALSKEARVIIMDEPTSSLSKKESDVLFNAIRSLKSKGVAIIYISHRLDELYQIAEKATILRDGKKIGTFNLSEEDVNSIVSKMIGSEIDEWYPNINNDIGDEILRVENLCSKWEISNINFQLYKREVLGIYGLLGSGRTEVMRMVCGIDKRKSGQIFLDGKQVIIKHPWDSIENGIVLVPENRKEQGLILNRDVEYNITLSILKNLLRGMKYDKKTAAELYSNYVTKFSIKISRWDQPVRYLSGGNQQKVILSKWLCANPRVLILDEPTRGIDVRTKKQIYDLIAELAHNGMSIILISSELPEIVNLCTRVLIMQNGRIRHEIEKENIKSNYLLALAMR